MSLDADLLAAHAQNDRAALATLYEQAADQSTEDDATFFYLTQALVFALETNAPNKKRIAKRLKKAGRL